MNKAPCKHETPQPDSCKWCDMAINKDQRYAKLWWDLDIAIQTTKTSATGTRKQVRKPCIACNKRKKQDSNG